MTGRWSPRLESNQYPTLRRHVHYPLCYGEDTHSAIVTAGAVRCRESSAIIADAGARLYMVNSAFLWGVADGAWLVVAAAV